jgi:hypothetical protein
MQRSACTFNIDTCGQQQRAAEGVVFRIVYLHCPETRWFIDAMEGGRRNEGKEILKKRVLSTGIEQKEGGCGFSAVRR